MPQFLPDRLFDATSKWLIESLHDRDIDRIIPENDPLRTWWNSGDGAGRLLEILSGAGDVLTWLALVEWVRARRRGVPPAGIDSLISEALLFVAGHTRSRIHPRPFDLFVSYCHRDMERAVAITEILLEKGLRVFQDIRNISAGESIVGSLHAAMTSASSVILLVTSSYSQSTWAHRELSYFESRRQKGDIAVLPVLLDDVPLPALISDTFTVDMRGFRGLQDREWAEVRLMKVVEACRSRQSYVP